MIPVSSAVVAKSRPKKIASWVLCATLLTATFVEIRITPRSYQGQSLFSLIFTKLAPAFPNPAADLRVFGLTADYVKYVGFNAYQPNSPIPSSDTQEAFAMQTGYDRVARYYLRHPRRAVAILAEDLRTNAIHMRPTWLSNYPTGRGNPELAKHFCSWSAVRTFMFDLWPMHICLWYSLFGACTAWLAVKGSNPSIRRLAWIGIGLAVIGMLEFCSASLTEVVETDRHLLLFHEFTDLMIWLSLTAIFIWFSSRINQGNRGIAYQLFGRAMGGLSRFASKSK